jgi:F0F1-type ATP synthase membrane subunit c/vacuolar-type H+-ATPase subunit K
VSQIVTQSPVAGIRPAPSGGETQGAAAAAASAWFSVIGICFGGVVPLLLITSVPLSEASSPAWTAACGLSVVAGLRYAWLVANGSRRLFELVFWLFTYVFMALAPLVQMRSGRYPATTPYLDTGLNGTAMAVIIAGAVAFAVGAGLAGSRTGGGAARQPALLSSVRVTMLATFALLFAAYFAYKVGVDALLTSRADRAQAVAALWPNSTTSAVVQALATWPLVISFAAALSLRAQRRRRGLRGPSVLPLVVLAVLLLLVNPISTPRYISGTALLAVAVSMGVATTRGRVRRFGVVLATGLVLVFPYADFARYAGGTSGEEGNSGGPASVLATSDFDAFAQVNNTVAYVAAAQEAQPELSAPGRQLVGVALFWVPRSIWEDKPKDTGILLAEFKGYAVTNLSAPLWSEFFINGGWVLLVFLMALLGWVVRRSDNRVIARSTVVSRPGVLAATLPFYFIILLRGSLLQAMAGLSVLVACGLFVTVRQPAAWYASRAAP